VIGSGSGGLGGAAGASGSALLGGAGSAQEAQVRRTLNRIKALMGLRVGMCQQQFANVRKEAVEHHSASHDA
jgi:hypothetical protein